MCSGPLGACPVGPQDPSTPWPPILYSFSCLVQAWLTCVAYGVASTRGSRAKPVSLEFRNLSGAREDTPCNHAFPPSCTVPYPTVARVRNTPLFMGLLGAHLDWAAPPACSSRELGEPVGFPGVAQAHLPDLVPGIRVSPRLLGLVTGSETELPATSCLLTYFMLQ